MPQFSVRGFDSTRGRQARFAANLLANAGEDETVARL